MFTLINNKYDYGNESIDLSTTSFRTSFCSFKNTKDKINSYKIISSDKSIDEVPANRTDRIDSSRIMSDKRSIDNNNNDNRFIKLLNNKYERKNNYVDNSKNIDEYINFKKRKSYTYSHYKNFNNKKKYYKKCVNDDSVLNKSYNDDYFLYNKNYNYNPIIESKNYPDLHINIEENNICDNNLISRLKSMNIEINEPITSYGIVLYTYEKNKYLKYLICQRRDSISYIQYLQDLIDENNIVKYINLMSIEEKNRCLEYYYKNDPHSIWKDLWINHNSKIYKNDYKRCTDIFLKNMEKNIEYFRDEKIGQKENSWCFPKGRLHHNENEIECALREFEEETCISSKNVTVDKNIKFEEVYIGSNNLLYKTIYYIAYIPYIPKKIYKYYPNNIRKKFISSEFFEIEWIEYQTAMERLDDSKKQILEKINNCILKRSFKK